MYEAGMEAGLCVKHETILERSLCEAGMEAGKI
jgi:hypothetical protein